MKKILFLLSISFLLLFTSGAFASDTSRIRLPDSVYAQIRTTPKNEAGVKQLHFGECLGRDSTCIILMRSKERTYSLYGAFNHKYFEFELQRTSDHKSLIAIRRSKIALLVIGVILETCDVAWIPEEDW